MVHKIGRTFILYYILLSEALENNLFAALIFQFILRFTLKYFEGQETRIYYF